MKKYSYLLLIAASCLFTACHKKQQQLDHIPGRILIGLKEGTPVESAFALANAEGWYLLSVEYYKYTSGFPKDSLASFSNTLLNTKSYINKIVLDTVLNGVSYNTPGWAIVQYDSIKNLINVSCTLMNMNIDAQADWLSTMSQLALTDKTLGGTVLYVKVPVGQEAAAIKKLQSNPIVSYAQLNGLSNMLL